MRKLYSKKAKKRIEQIKKLKDEKGNDIIVAVFGDKTEKILNK